MGQSELLTDSGWLVRVYLRRARRAIKRSQPSSSSVEPTLRSCIILGSGRSGTSMLAGSLAQLGYFMGDSLIPPGDANPKGFFEDYEINRINDGLIARALPSTGVAPGTGWLAPVPVGTQFVPRPSLVRRIVAQTTKKPFCFNDPRFCYTLPAWLPHVDDVAVLCIFREPARTANSIVKECREAPYLTGVVMDFQQAIQIWTLMYEHVLEHHRRGGNWVFVHYDQVLDGSSATRLGAALRTAINASSADSALRRSPPTGLVGPEVQQLYNQLCALAGFNPESALAEE